MKTEALWTDALSHPAFDSPARLPESLDVAVIGGGYSGLTAAFTLAKRGLSVAVLERGRIGAGASSVNGGQLCPGLKRSPQQLFKAYGEDLARELWWASVESVRTVEELIESEGIECAYEPNGSICLAYRPSHFRRLVSSAEWLDRQLGYKKGVVSPDRIRTEIGSDLFHGGLTDSRGGGLHPARFVIGLARAAGQAGALLVEGAEVGQVDSQGGSRLCLQIGSRTVRADQVLVATNGFANDLVPGLRRRVLPIGSYQVATEPIAEELRTELSPRKRMFFDTRRFLNYFRLTSDGRVVFGGRNDLSVDFPLTRSALNLRSSMLRVFPQLKDVRITHSWSGTLGFTFDLLPHIGRLGGIWYVVGFCGHGLGLATHLGREAAKMMLGELSRSAFAEITHPGHPLFRRRAWFLPIVSQYYRTLDYVM